jgi:hypothetical protein
MRLAALQCGKALPYRETLDMFGGYASPDKRRHSLESDIDSPVRHSITALGSGRAAERKCAQVANVFCQSGSGPYCLAARA